MISPPRLGVCYYPEHWPDHMWAEDARRMADIGIRQVRIGEFAWSRIEPEPGRFDWGWLDRAMETLGAAGLKIMLGTPTATPPKWLIDAHPDILAHDREGRPRRFGSRRHYCFSSRTYRREAARIVRAVAERYGQHEALTAWQTDNEYGCHDTVRSTSPEAARAFRLWLLERYGTIEALNTAWGTVFWSQEYRSFEDVDLPVGTVTEPNPSHVLDYYRFSSDEVISFNRMQTEILRRHSPGRDIVHNVMGFFFDFDHFALGADLDSVGWDSYPLGFLDVIPFPLEDKSRYLHQGHPDVAAFHHDLYRACGTGRWQVLEQQPGPVNWAHHNPAPLPGMVRAWGLEAYAHGAEAVSYFRWRQAPFAQEQMHAGLLRADDTPAPGYDEARQVARDLGVLRPSADIGKAPVALVFSYDALWLFEAQPQGAAWSYPLIAFEWYSALRQRGLDVDIVSPQADLSDHALVLVPSLPVLDEAFLETLKRRRGPTLLGPRTGSKTQHLTIPPNLAPGRLQEILPVRVTHSESFPAFHTLPAQLQGRAVAGGVWLDHVESPLIPLAQSVEGHGLLYEAGGLYYLASVPDTDFLSALLEHLMGRAGLTPLDLPPDLRLRSRGDTLYAINYGPAPVELPDDLGPADDRFLIGNRILGAGDVAAWKR